MGWPNSRSGVTASCPAGAKSGNDIERDIAVQPLLQHSRCLDHQHGVTVRRGLGDGIDADGAARAGPVLDHPRLLKSIGENSGKHPADGVDAAAGRDRHD